MSEPATSHLVEFKVGELLRQCCEQRLLAVVALPEQGAGVRAQFYAADDTGLDLLIFGGVAIRFPELSSCVVSYSLDKIIHTFVAPIERFVPGAPPAPSRLRLLKPPYIVRGELRRWFRVPIPDEAPVRLALEDSGYQTHQPGLVDASHGGLLVEFPLDQDPNLDLGSPVKVTLELDDNVARYFAEIRHHRDGRYGLMFVELPDADTALKDEAAFRKILDTLQALWLEARSRDSG
jgi:hypothetical protein